VAKLTCLCTTQSGSKRALRDVVRLRSSSLTRKNTRNNVANSCLNCCFTGIHFSCVVVEKSRVWSGWSSSGRVASFSGWPASVPASLSQLIHASIRAFTGALDNTSACGLRWRSSPVQVRGAHVNHIREGRTLFPHRRVFGRTYVKRPFISLFCR
jgi:hypothetical protein